MRKKLPRLYPNVISDYIPYLVEAINTGKWLLKPGRLIDPLSFIHDYGGTWFLNEGSLILKHPDEVIREAESRELTEAQRIRLDAFKARVMEYRARNIDALLLQALRENRFPPELVE